MKYNLHVSNVRTKDHKEPHNVCRARRSLQKQVTGDLSLCLPAAADPHHGSACSSMYVYRVEQLIDLGG